MQTFIALLLKLNADGTITDEELHWYFYDCACVLDKRRCGKQRVEAKQILDILEGRSASSWKNHPAVRQWKGYEMALRMYINAFIDVWVREHQCINNMAKYEIPGVIHVPPFLYNIHFVQRHQSNLLAKDEEYYSIYCWNVTKRRGYYWYIGDMYKLINENGKAFLDLDCSTVAEDEDLIYVPKYIGDNPNGCRYIYKHGKAKGMRCCRDVHSNGYCNRCITKASVKRDIGYV